MNPSSHKFRGTSYQIRWRHPNCLADDGCCDPPTAKNPKIFINPDIKGKDKLRVLLDEATHACYWDLDNDIVNKGAESMASFLWKCGVRFKDE